MTQSAISEAVATPETWTPSRRMRAAASAERTRVERELGRLTSRETQLADELSKVRDVREELERELLALNRFAEEPGGEEAEGKGHEPRLRVVAGTPTTGADESALTTLRGAAIRETAVRVLANTAQVDEAVHYRTWFELFRQEGFVPAGKDALATFLTQIGRSPLVQRTTSAGMYTLDLEYPRRARARLEALRSELGAEQATPVAGVDEIALARERRRTLSAEVEATERALQEALRSLGEAA